MVTINIQGRARNISQLQELLDSPRPEFLALYGRRRIGKTYLIKEFFKQQEVYFFKVTGSKEGKMKEQLKHFVEQISETFYSNIPLAECKNWDEALRLLTKAMTESAGNKKIVLFLDELPWLASKNSRLLQNIDYYWNQHWTDNARIKLIVCGSSSSWIIKKIIKNKGGLHNRITARMHLSPFSLQQSKDFLKHQGIDLNNKQVTQLYMAIGGIPYYLTQVRRGKSAAQIIENLAFSKKSFLSEEFDSLFSSLFENHELHIAILREIASTRSGLLQETLTKRLEKIMSRQNVINKLEELKDADFITSFKPLFHKKRGKYFRVIDEYTQFYFKWIEPLRDTLENESIDNMSWQTMQNPSEWRSWLGYSFESMCYKHISTIRQKLNITPGATASTWRYVPQKGSTGKGAQIDLLFDRRDGAITICEIKFTTEPFIINKGFMDNIAQKLSVFKRQTQTKKQLFVSLISANGLQNNYYADSIIVDTMNLDDFFE